MADEKQPNVVNKEYEGNDEQKNSNGYVLKPKSTDELKEQENFVESMRPNEIEY